MQLFVAFLALRETSFNFSRICVSGAERVPGIVLRNAHGMNVKAKNPSLYSAGRRRSPRAYAAGEAMEGSGD